MDTRAVIARFEAERQALALMDHPNIARVLDAGATETGRPYFVMELVRGIKITEYCDQHKLSTSERLTLFIQVCHAIQHAHQKGIIQEKVGLAGHDTVVWSIAFSPDGHCLATVSSDQTVRLWDVDTCSEQARLLGHGHEVWSVAFSPSGETVATGGHDETVLLWNSTPKLQTTFDTPIIERIRGLPFVAFSPDGQLIAARTPARNIIVWEVHTGVQCAQFLNASNGVLRFVDGGRTLATIDPEGTLDLWDLRDQQHQQIPRDPPGITSFPIDLSPDGIFLAENGIGGRVVLRNARSGSVVRAWQAHDSRVYGLKFSPDARLLATGSAEPVAKVWDVATGRLLVELRAHKDGIEGFDFSPDGRWLATSSLDSSVRVWTVPSGQLICSLFGHKEGAYSVSFSSDGRTLASAATSACLWNMATQREVLSIPNATQVAFAPDGKSLAFFTPQPKTAPSGKLQVWHAPALAEIEARESAQDAVAPDPSPPAKILRQTGPKRRHYPVKARRGMNLRLRGPRLTELHCERSACSIKASAPALSHYSKPNG